MVEQRKTVENLFAGCKDSVVNNTGRQQNKEVDNKTTHIEDYYVKSEIVQDDSRSNTKLKGTGRGSLIRTKVEGGEVKFLQDKTKIHVENDGGPNTKTSILSAKRAKVEIESKDSEEIIEGKFGPGAKVCALEAIDGAHVKRKANKLTIKIVQK